MEKVPNVVNVNVGGRLFTTSRGTLCKVGNISFLIFLLFYFKYTLK